MSTGLFHPSVIDGQVIYDLHTGPREWTTDSEMCVPKNKFVRIKSHLNFQMPVRADFRVWDRLESHRQWGFRLVRMID